ncbi:unnamed protein product [Camellia sinensis]
MKNQENLGSEVNPSGDSWSDSCLEFAFKTLTGALARNASWQRPEGKRRALGIITKDIGGTASYLLGMSGCIAAQADEASNLINVKNLSLGWMIGFLFLMMILKYKLTYPSGTATAYLINNFHTPKGAKLAKKQVMMLFYSLCGSFTNALFQWFFAAANGCGFSNFPTFGLKAFSQSVLMNLTNDNLCAVSKLLPVEDWVYTSGEVAGEMVVDEISLPSEDGNISLPPGSLIVLAHKEKEITNALEGEGAQLKKAEVAYEVALMSQTNMYRLGIDVTQAELVPHLNWRQQERTEVVGNWKAKIYDMLHVMVSVKSRRVPGAMTDEELFFLESALRMGNSDVLCEDEDRGVQDCHENGDSGSYESVELKEKKSWFGWNKKGSNGVVMTGGEVFLYLSVILAFLSILITIFSLRHRSNDGAKLPPGNFGWPIIGESIEFLFGKPENFVNYMMKKDSREIFKTKIFKEKTTVMCGPNGNKFLFSNERKIFTGFLPHSIQKLFLSSKPKPVAAPSFPPPQVVGAVAADGVKEVIRTPGFFKLEVYPLAKTLTLLIACRIFLGMENPNRIARLVRYFDDVTLGLHSIMVNFPSTNFYRAGKATDAIRREKMAMVRERRAAMVGGGGAMKQDILSHMIVVSDSTGKGMG